MQTQALLSWRKYIALNVMLGFAVLSATGLVMFFWPPREIAIATGYTLLGLNKPEWEQIHLSFSFLFIGAAAFHLWLNRRVLLGYLANRSSQRRTNREFLIAFLAAAALVGIALL